MVRGGRYNVNLLTVLLMMREISARKIHNLLVLINLLSLLGEGLLVKTLVNGWDLLLWLSGTSSLIEQSFMFNDFP